MWPIYKYWTKRLKHGKHDEYVPYKPTIKQLEYKATRIEDNFLFPIRGFRGNRRKIHKIQ
jgi:hypothetical protein